MRRLLQFASYTTFESNSSFGAADVDETAFENQHVQHLMKVRMGDRQGIGVLEQSIFGPYRPYGLEGHIAPPG